MDGIVSQLYSILNLAHIGYRAGSSMRLVRLKPQGPGHDRGPDRRYNENLQSRTTLGQEISREEICGLDIALFSRHVNVCLVMSLLAPDCNYLFRHVTLVCQIIESACKTLL